MNSVQQHLLKQELISLRFNGRPVSPLHLATEVNRLAEWLSYFNEPGVIALVSKDSWQLVLFIYACARINRPFMPVNPDLTANRLVLLLKQAGCKRVFSDISIAGLGADIDVINVKLFDHKQIERPKPLFPNTFVSLIIATSGSTGQPKGVMLSVEALNESAKTIAATLNLKADDCWLNCLPLFHIGGLSIFYRCAYAQAKMSLHASFNAEAVWEDINNNRITHVSLVPAMLFKLLEESADMQPPATLRVVLIGGAALSVALAKRAHKAGWPLVVSYGMTETGSLFACDVTVDAGLLSGKVGSPLNNVNIVIDQTSDKIKVESTAMMSGYLNPELTPGAGLVNGLLTTNDIGKVDNDGALHVFGRADDMLISGGKNIHPREIEEQLEAFVGVGRVVVSSVSDPVWGDRIVAIYDNPGVDNKAFESWAKQHVIAGLRPRLFVQAKKLPTNGMGKLDRCQLKKIIQHLRL